MNGMPDPRRVPNLMNCASSQVAGERPRTPAELRKEQMDRAVDDELVRMAAKWDYERY